MLGRIVWCLVADMTSGKSTTEGTAVKAWGIPRINYGHTRADTTARICALFDRVLAVDSTALRARLRDVPDVDFVGEPRPDRDYPCPDWHDHSRERRVREVVRIRCAEESAGEGGEVERGEEGSGAYRGRAQEDRAERVEGCVCREDFDCGYGARGTCT